MKKIHSSKKIIKKTRPIFVGLLFSLLVLSISNNAYQNTKLQNNNVTKLVIINTDAIKNEQRIKSIELAISDLMFRPTESINSNVYISTEKGGGSGSIIKIDDTGTYVLTAAHIITDIIGFGIGPIDGDFARNIEVNTSNNKKYPATVLRRDSKNDLAIILINKKLDIKPVPIAKELSKVGDVVWHISNPGGFTGLINKGVVSKINDDEVTVSVAGFFGSSGGMVLNTRGEQIGLISTVAIANIGRFTPSLTVYNGITRTDILNKFLRGIVN